MLHILLRKYLKMYEELGYLVTVLGYLGILDKDPISFRL